LSPSFVAHLAGASADAELAFTRAKIDANFSNYSAWHYRSSLLRAAPAEAPEPCAPLFAPHARCGEGQLSPALLSAELSLVQSAFFTEPDDQAGWFYSDWLVSEQLSATAAQASLASSPADADAARQACAAALTAQAEACRQLAGAEPACRWPRLGLLRLLRALDACGAPGAGGRRAEARTLLAELAGVDALRRGMYADWEGEWREED